MKGSFFEISIFILRFLHKSTPLSPIQHHSSLFYLLNQSIIRKFRKNRNIKSIRQGRFIKFDRKTIKMPTGQAITALIQRNSRNHLHIQHPRFNFLSINTKRVVEEDTPPHFYPTSKISRRFKKT